MNGYLRLFSMTSNFIINILCESTLGHFVKNILRLWVGNYLVNILYSSLSYYIAVYRSLNSLITLTIEY